MHGPFRHTTLPQTTTPWLAAQGHDLTDEWSLPSTHFTDSLCPFQCSFGCILLLNQMFWKQCTVRQYHSDLSDQSALQFAICTLSLYGIISAFQHGAQLVKEVKAWSSDKWVSHFSIGHNWRKRSKPGRRIIGSVISPFISPTVGCRVRTLLVHGIGAVKEHRRRCHYRLAIQNVLLSIQHGS